MKKNIKDIVLELTEQYRTTNPFELVEALDGILVYAPLKGVRGFYQHYKDVDIVYIDENLSEREQEIICSHELGHMILHKSINYFFLNQKTYDSTKRYEIEADSFAAELLISDSDILNHIDLTKSQLATMLHIDQELIELKVLNLQQAITKLITK